MFFPCGTQQGRLQVIQQTRMSTTGYTTCQISRSILLRAKRSLLVFVLTTASFFCKNLHVLKVHLTPVIGGGTVDSYRLSSLRSIQPLALCPLRGLAKGSVARADTTPNMKRPDHKFRVFKGEITYKRKPFSKFFLKVHRLLPTVLKLFALLVSL